MYILNIKTSQTHLIDFNLKMLMDSKIKSVTSVILIHYMEVFSSTQWDLIKAHMTQAHTFKLNFNDSKPEIKLKL